jgi:hypothetical protein
MTYSKSICLDAIREVSDRTSDYMGADTYRNLKDEDHPSVASIANYLGSWTEAKKELNMESLENEAKRTPGNACSINTSYFDELNEESAYWLGFIYADAHITNSSTDGRPRFALKISVKDIDLLKRFKNDIDSDHKLTRETREGNSSDTVALATTNEDFCCSILQHNLKGDKTHNGSLPDLPEELWKHWFRGLFDGDGYSRFSAGTPNINITGSYDRMENLREIIPTEPTLSTGDKGSGRLDFYGDNARGIVDWMYPEGADTEPKLDRKFPDWY